MTILLDTCIVIDALQKREPFFKNAQSIFLSAANRLFVGYLTAKSISDVYYLMHHVTHSDSESRDLISKLLMLFELVDTQGLDCINALASPISDFEDAIMVETAKRECIDYIVTRNFSDYVNSSIPVLSPDDFLKNLNN